MKNYFVLGLALAIGGAAQAAIIDFEAFGIRGGGTATELAGQNGVEFVTAAGGDKAGYGTSYFNGMQFESLQSVSFLIENAPGPWMPYINIWITDGLGNYAIIANEPSNPEYNSYYANYPYAADNTQVSLNLTGMTFKIHETLQVPNPPNTNYGWLGGDSFITYAELSASNWTIAGPTNWGGTGAPKAGHGFNLVYGDTLSNYVSGNEGYIISDVTINGNLEAGAVVPVPAAAPLGLLGMGLVGFIARRRKQQS